MWWVRTPSQLPFQNTREIDLPNYWVKISTLSGEIIDLGRWIVECVDRWIEKISLVTLDGLYGILKILARLKKGRFAILKNETRY